MVTYSWDNSHCGSSSDRYVVVTNSLLRVRQVHGQAVQTDGKTEGKTVLKDRRVLFMTNTFELINVILACRPGCWVLAELRGNHE